MDNIGPGLSFLMLFPWFVAGIAWYVTYDKVRIIMRKENPKFTGSVNNPSDLIRVYKVFRNSSTITEDERKQLKQSLILVGICYLNALIVIPIFILEFM